MSDVSVLMTVYNGGQYLKAAVESILAQTLSDFVFVIVNDGSTDETVEYLATLTDPRIRIIHQDNQGTAAAANRGLSTVDTQFVARMDADDIALPNRLELQTEFMLANPEVGVVGAQVAPMGERSVGKSLKIPTAHDAIFDALMKLQHGMAHNSIMIRTQILKDIGGYWPYRLVDDWDMMLRMGEVSRLANLDQVLLHYRLHSGSLTGSSQLRMHQHYGYAIERARRRQQGLAEIEYDEYLEQRRNRPVWVRLSEGLHIHAITQYRQSMSEIHGSRPLLGYLRLAWAAACSPSRALHRIGRMTRSK